MSSKSAPRPSGPRRPQGLSQWAIPREGRGRVEESGATAGGTARRCCLRPARPLHCGALWPLRDTGSPLFGHTVKAQDPALGSQTVAPPTQDHRPQSDHPQRDNAPQNAPPRKRRWRRLRPPKAPPPQGESRSKQPATPPFPELGPQLAPRQPSAAGPGRTLQARGRHERTAADCRCHSPGHRATRPPCAYLSGGRRDDGRGGQGHEPRERGEVRAARRLVWESSSRLYSHSRLGRDTARSVLFIGSSGPPPGALIGCPGPGNPRPSAAVRRGPEAIGRGAVREPRGGASKPEKKERERGVGEGRQRRPRRAGGRRCWKHFQLASFSDLWTLRLALRLPPSLGLPNGAKVFQESCR
ncbi:basic salivary proline-rich protein 3-like [Cricetulus griseus]|uniref:Basic salivary proline-rich protein 3-like n=1 Tax=Cricetulus griseus TaxID=10029 RepID=A0A9J7JSX2_CRIGR|nr:basic salivary proline-rich protein 3-like [Cricetulus griseus]